MHLLKPGAQPTYVESMEAEHRGSVVALNYANKDLNSMDTAVGTVAFVVAKSLNALAKIEAMVYVCDTSLLNDWATS